MGSMELAITTDLSKEVPQKIEWNYLALKNELAERLEVYQGLVVTEDGVTEAKADLAKLRALATALDDRRKGVKKELLAPYLPFESEVKELLRLIDGPVAEINKQLTEFEDQRKEKKRAEIKALYEKIVSSMAAILPLDKIWNDRWLNKTFAINEISAEIAGRVERVKSDLEVIGTIEGEYQEACKIEYLDTLDIAKAMRKKADLEKRAEELRRHEQQEHMRRFMGQDSMAQEPPAAQIKVGKTPPSPAPVAATAGAIPSQRMYTLAFGCRLTAQDADALKEFFEGRRIEFWRLNANGSAKHAG